MCLPGKIGQCFEGHISNILGSPPSTIVKLENMHISKVMSVNFYARVIAKLNFNSRTFVSVQSRKLLPLTMSFIFLFWRFTTFNQHCLTNFFTLVPFPAKSLENAKGI